MRSETERKLVIITTENKGFVKKLEKRLHFKADRRIMLAESVYDEALLASIRAGAYAYLHGHEAGGTNPSLLESLAATALLLILFPVLAWLLSSPGKREEGGGRLLKAGLIAAPLFFWLLTFVLAWQMEFLEKVMNGTPLYNMFVRFVQAGAALRLYGFSAFPRTILCDGSLFVDLSGWRVYLLQLDNAYAFYTMAWGLLVMGAGLIWLSIGIRKCLKEKAYGLLAAALFICLYGLMERITLQPEYNFMLFYPLAAATIRRAGS